MKTDHDILTPDDLVELTGHHYKAQQCLWLSKAGIWYAERRDGSPSTTWFHIANPIALRKIDHNPERDTPNFTSM
jgi:hypothetical protein